jgi:hypothetical protein
MAPNRKTVTSLVETLSSGDLAGLQDTLQSQFKPLTDAKESVTTAAAAADTAAATAASSTTTTSTKSTHDVSPAVVSYWDWPAADDQLQEEAATTSMDLLFSASHMEANLTKEATKWTSKQQQQIAANEETNLSVEEPKHAQLGTSYWDFVADEDTKYATINRILADERARLLVSGAAIEAIETRAAAEAAASVRDPPPTERASDDYWGWESSRDTVWKPSDGIQALLQYEEAREFLRGGNIVSHLQQWKEPEPTPVLASSNEYWAW